MKLTKHECEQATYMTQPITTSGDLAQGKGLRGARVQERKPAVSIFNPVVETRESKSARRNPTKFIPRWARIRNAWLEW